jgi:hypothetical protein
MKALHSMGFIPDETEGCWVARNPADTYHHRPVCRDILGSIRAFEAKQPDHSTIGSPDEALLV